MSSLLMAKMGRIIEQFEWGGIPLTSLFLFPYYEAWQCSLPPSC